jgi:hypothetical protein
MLPYFPQSFPHGVILLMLATLPHGLISCQPKSKSTSLVSFLCILATWIKLVPHSNIDSYPNPIHVQTYEIFVAIQPVTGQVHSDLTGRLTTTFTASNSYLMVVYDYDSNFIHVEPLKSQSGPCNMAAYLHHGFFQPRLQRLDNEASNALLQFMASVQLSPHIHRRKAAERAIHR